MANIHHGYYYHANTSHFARFKINIFEYLYYVVGVVLDLRVQTFYVTLYYQLVTTAISCYIGFDKVPTITVGRVA
jgi:hypothetical protein